MHSDSVLFSMFLIFSGAAAAATLGLYLRQTIIVTYLVLGAVLGPWGLGMVTDAELIEGIAEIGIIFLLFLLGLNLNPAKLLHLLRSTALVTLLCTLALGAVVSGVAWAYGLSLADGVIIGAAASFSSTIVGLKLLPTTALHHRRIGEVIISVLLLQDLLAILVMLFIHSYGQGGLPLLEIVTVLAALPLLTLLAYLGSRFMLLPLMARFDRIQEYMFLAAIGWCLGLAQLAHFTGLSHAIGAFIAGVALASSPLALHIAERFKPLRDFFLIIFFFGIGAGFHLSAAAAVFVPAAVIAASALLIKPLVFRYLLVRQLESKQQAWETGVRLGQMSEFSLLVVFVAHESGIISDNAFYIVQLATVLTFIVSAYYIVARYPTPIAFNDRLRRD